MSWLFQNWTWVVVAVGGFFMIAHHMGGHRMSRSMAHDGYLPNDDDAGPVTPVDPVTRQMLPADAAISTVFQGRAYYFENREHRDAFPS